MQKDEMIDVRRRISRVQPGCNEGWRERFLYCETRSWPITRKEHSAIFVNVTDVLCYAQARYDAV